jgi:hypothetical protein
MSVETEMMQLLAGMVDSADMNKLRLLTVTAYDTFALKAMEVMIDKEGLPGEGGEAIFADAAWALADAMMLERAKRGLGQIIAVPADSVASSNGQAS